MNWRWVSLAALLAALVIGYGALVDRSPAPATSGGQAEQPGYYLTDAVITQTRQDGALNLRLIATRIEQRSDDSIAMDTVRVNYFQAPGREWVLTAQEGFVPANFRVVHLTGNVELRPADAKPAAFLRTEALAIDTETNVAYSTTSPTRIKFGQHTMIAKNFRADLNTEKIQLESVNAHFDPE